MKLLANVNSTHSHAMFWYLTGSVLTLVHTGVVHTWHNGREKLQAREQKGQGLDSPEQQDKSGWEMRGQQHLSLPHSHHWDAPQRDSFQVRNLINSNLCICSMCKIFISLKLSHYNVHKNELGSDDAESDPVLCQSVFPCEIMFHIAVPSADGGRLWLGMAK